MKLYADAGPRFARQIVLDVLFVCWVLGCIWLGSVVHDGTLSLATPGERIATSATSLAGSLGAAGDSLSGIPLIGDGVAAPFDSAAAASDSLAGAGTASVRAVQRLAFWLGLAVAVIPILWLGQKYLPGRVRFVVDSTAAQRLMDGSPDLELFALRAMTTQPLHVLARVSADPAGAWRRGDQDVITALAALELRASGLRAPAPRHGAAH